ncbi:MAG: hypothetical protein WAU68_04245 [Vitreimonas sp.]
MGLALSIEELLGGARRAVPEPQIEAGAVHNNGMVDIARLIPRGGAASVRTKASRSILAAPKQGPIS